MCSAMKASSRAFKSRTLGDSVRSMATVPILPAHDGPTPAAFPSWNRASGTACWNLHLPLRRPWPGRSPRLSSDETSAYGGTVPPQHAIDRIRLAAWLRDHVEGFQGPVEIEQFKGGQSNPTYKLASPSGSYVLRRKPLGSLLPSAHPVDRE